MRTLETESGLTITAEQEHGAFIGRVTIAEDTVTHLSFEHHNAAAAADTLRVLIDRAYGQGAQSPAAEQVWHDHFTQREGT